MMEPSVVGAKIKSAGFTLIELLVAIAIIGILAALLLPVLAKGKSRAQQAYCLSNGRQLMTAMTMYSGDFNDLLPPNPDDGNTIAGHNWCSGQAGRGGSSEFDPDLLKDPAHSLLASYLKGNVTVFHCPADMRSGLYQGTDPAYIGKIVSAARTFSMNQAAGTICQKYDETGGGYKHGSHGGPPSLPVDGPWLNNLGSHRRDSPWITYGRLSNVRAPGPAMLWILVDEDDRNLNDAAFAFGMNQPIWIDAPGAYHDGGCGFAFADAHSETHHWKSPSSKMGHQTPVTTPADFQDWQWMREHTSANISGEMPPPDAAPRDQNSSP